MLPLYFGMTEGGETKATADHLTRLVRENGNHLATGFPGIPYLLFALSDHEHTDTAFDLLLQENCPSWLYEVKAGGPTIWERWARLGRMVGSTSRADGRQVRGRMGRRHGILQSL